MQDEELKKKQDEEESKEQEIINNETNSLHILNELLCKLLIYNCLKILMNN
jgi:hypothetical protein